MLTNYTFIISHYMPLLPTLTSSIILTFPTQFNIQYASCSSCIIDIISRSFTFIITKHLLQLILIILLIVNLRNLLIQYLCIVYIIICISIVKVWFWIIMLLIYIQLLLRTILELVIVVQCMGVFVM
jgi:hypothetical protein